MVRILQATTTDTEELITVAIQLQAQVLLALQVQVHLLPPTARALIVQAVSHILDPDHTLDLLIQDLALIILDYQASVNCKNTSRPEILLKLFKQFNSLLIVRLNVMPSQLIFQTFWEEFSLQSRLRNLGLINLK